MHWYPKSDLLGRWRGDRREWHWNQFILVHPHLRWCEYKHAILKPIEQLFSLASTISTWLRTTSTVMNYTATTSSSTTWRGGDNGRFFNFLFCVSRTLLIQKPVENWKLEVISSTKLQSLKIISTKCQTFQMFLKVVSFNQMSRRHIDGLTRMEVTLPTSSIQTTLSFPQRLMWVNVLDGFPFFWWHMVFLKRCYIMFVFILPRKVTFNSLGNTGGMRLGWRVTALHWSTWQNDARNSELSLGGLARCVSIWIYSYFLGGHRFEIHNWARLCVGRRIQYHVQVSIKLKLWAFLIWWVISPTQGWPTWFRRCGLAWRRQLSGMTRYLESSNGTGNMYVNTSFEPPMFVLRSIALWPFPSTYPWEGKKIPFIYFFDQYQWHFIHQGSIDRPRLTSTGTQQRPAPSRSQCHFLFQLSESNCWDHRDYQHNQWW